MSSEEECPVAGSNQMVMMQGAMDDLRELCSRRSNSKSPRVPDPTQIWALPRLCCAQPKFRDATTLFFMYGPRRFGYRGCSAAGPSFGPDLPPFLTPRLGEGCHRAIPARVSLVAQIGPFVPIVLGLMDQSGVGEFPNVLTPSFLIFSIGRRENS